MSTFYSASFSVVVERNFFMTVHWASTLPHHYPPCSSTHADSIIGILYALHGHTESMNVK